MNDLDFRTNLRDVDPIRKINKLMGRGNRKN